MKKKIFAVLFAFAMFVSAFGIVAHAETTAYVIVSDNLIYNEYMTEDELVDLQKTGIEFETIYGYAALFVVVDDYLIDAYESPESVYYELTDNPNGMLVVANEYIGDYEYFFAGDGEAVFGGEIDRLIEAYDVESTYYGGIAAYYFTAEDIITAFNSMPDNSYTDDGYSENDGYIEDTDEDSDYDYEEDVDAETEDSEEGLPAVIDDAGLLKESEIKDLDKKLRDLSEEYGIEFVAVSVEDTDGLTLNKYADMIYKYGGFKDSGIKNIVFFIYQHGEEGDREIVIVRYGDKAKDELSDADCEKIINNVKDDFEDGNYSKAFESFVEETEKVFNPSVHWIWIPLCLIIGFVIAFVIMKIIASANKSVRKKVDAVDYVKLETLTITNAADIFLYTETHSTPKANSSSSGDTDEGGRSTSSGKF